jgi:prepilin-type processing-associated H-X9-DG protein
VTTTAPVQSGAQPKTSGLAIVALVCGLLGVCTLGIGAILGIVLGAVASSQIKKSGGQVTGRGMAIAGIILGVLSILVLIALVVLAGVGMFAAVPKAVGLVEEVQGQATSIKSMNNVRQLCMAAMQYSVANNGRLPPADTWPSVMREFGIPDEVLRDPDSPGGIGYAMNRMVSGKPLSQVRQPSQTVLFFESSPGPLPAGGREMLPPQPRHGRGYVIGFVDGHSGAVPPDEVDRLIWNPDQE